MGNFVGPLSQLFRARISVFAQPDRHLFLLRRVNTTSSMTLRSSPTCPETSELVFDMTCLLHDRIEQAEAAGHPNVFFSEEHRPLLSESERAPGEAAEVPSEDEIYSWLHGLTTNLAIPGSVLVAAVIYVERLLAEAGMFVLVSSWRPIMLGAVCLATKMWFEPASRLLAALATYPPALAPAELRLLESSLFIQLGYRLTITPSLYSKYYFHLRTLHVPVGEARGSSSFNNGATAQQRRKVCATLEARGGRRLGIADSVLEATALLASHLGSNRRRGYRSVDSSPRPTSHSPTQPSLT